MKKDTSNTIKRAQRFPVILIGEGCWWARYPVWWSCSTGSRLHMPGMAERDPCFYKRTSAPDPRLVRGAHPAGPDRGAAGKMGADDLRKRHPQVEGEVLGKLKEDWKRVLPAKFIGGFLCLFGGLSLGREGPSIQLGAMGGQGVPDSLTGEDRRALSHDLRGERGTGGGLSRAAGGHDVRPGGDP